MADLLLACYGRLDRPSFPGTGSPGKPGMTGSAGVGLLQAEAVKDRVTGLLGSMEDEIDPLAVDVDALRLVDQLCNIL